MLYPKFSQRSLAVIVCCLILVLGLSTLFLVYSFCLHRSPLIVESVEKIIPNAYSRKTKDNRLSSIKFYKESTTVKPKIIDVNGSNILTATFNQSTVPYWVSKKNFSDTDDNTIYIDDFERNKTNLYTIETTTVADYTQQTDRSLRKNVQTEEQHLNLDAVYDRNRDGNESYDTVEDEDEDDEEDDDTDDDWSAYGSGSGDFALSDYTENMPLLEYDLPPQITDVSKGRKPKKLSVSGKKKYADINYQDVGIVFAANNVKKLSKNGKSERRRYAKRMKNELDQIVAPFASTTEMRRPKLNYYDKHKNKNKNKYNKKAKIQEIITTTMKTTTTIRQDQDQAQRYDKTAIRVQHQMNPSTWVETRTRRVLGNVRKSEERSRQLLLCEEAGGGELCRMLFKGHSTE